MTYNYATTQVSPLYHIVKVGRVYALCGLWVQRGKIISPEPPAGKKECRQCAKVLREQSGNASAPKS
jgi:hypothetical protein